MLGLSKRTHLTGRGIVRLVRIARTIADVAESERVTQDHVLEGGDVPGKEGPIMDEETYQLHPGDALYPETVLELSDVPQTLYVRGNPEVLSTPAVSIIGARKASPYGLAVAELAAKVAVEAGVTVVSGGAVGCDQASGWAAVNAGGKHIVVLGTGADVVYPRSSAGLITRTLDTGGAVVSISPWGMGPRKFAFPRRNRVIAALSQALFVSEAGMPSGTFSTAEAAMDLGRELLAVPGSILRPSRAELTISLLTEPAALSMRNQSRWPSRASTARCATRVPMHLALPIWTQHSRP